MCDVVRQTIRVFTIPGESIEITTHRLDWGTSRDLGELSAERCFHLGQRLQRGAWFVCPKFTVYSATPSADFFKAAREARSHWLMQVRRVMGKGDPRREKRKVERRGRRAAYLDLQAPVVNGRPPERPPEAISLSDLPENQRSAVFVGGMLAKEFAFTGVMFIDGNHILPWTWNQMADDLLPPRPSPHFTVTRRRVNLEAFKTTGDPEPLEQMAREVLQAYMESSPTHAAFVTPDRTVSAPVASPAFFREGERQKTAWCTLLNRVLGCGNVRRAIRAVDDQTVTLVYRGTLVINGEFYLPGLWPNGPTNPGRLKRTPFQAPTVPPAFLGLNPSPG